MTHQPKGSMCANCTKQKQDCSKLDFSKMRPIELYQDVRIVRCSAFEREKDNDF